MGLLDTLLDLIYPPRCIFCTDLIPIQKEKGICEDCRSSLPFIQGSTCQKCGKPIQETAHRTICDDCIKHPPIYEKGWSVFIYEGMVKDAIYRFKYGGHQEYAKYFGILMAEKIKQQISKEDFDLLIPIPIHPKRKKTRGYNQAEELAKVISKDLNISIDSSILIRAKETKPQSGLSLIQRQNNMRSAFKVKDNINIRQMKILLVDDIYTTGSTIQWCTHLLKEKGAGQVCFISLSIGQGMN